VRDTLLIEGCTLLKDEDDEDGLDMIKLQSCVRVCDCAPAAVEMKRTEARVCGVLL